MKTLKNTSVYNFESLATTIQQTNSFFLDKVQRQVNTALTFRNWIIGYYIVEYEQSGKDKADYGLGLFKAIAKRLLKKGVKSLQERNLYLCRDFYRAYPRILQTESAILPEANESSNLNLLLTNIPLDLKIGEYDHSDAGQMNMYLNYYKDNEFTDGANNPIGIILCSGKNEALVKYATMGLPQQVFVSKYLINLPSEKELQKIFEDEKEKRL